MNIKEILKDYIVEDTKYELKAKITKDDPIKWAKTIVGYANIDGGYIFIGVDNNGEIFGLTYNEIDEYKNLILLINNRNIIPHVKLDFSLKSLNDVEDRYVLIVKVYPSNSIVRYKEGDYKEIVFIKGDGNSSPATPEEIISLGKKKYGIDNEVTNIKYNEEEWKEYINLCKEYRGNNSKPSLKELQSEDIVSKDGFVKTGFWMFKDDYNDENSRINCRLWKGKTKSGIVLDNQKLKGSIAICFKQAFDFILRNTKIGWEKDSQGGRVEIRSYPLIAIREVLVNAFAHRDYSIDGTQIDVDIFDDRIDVSSPGSWMLPKGYYEYDEGTIPSIRRNQIISASLDVANLMERGGTGFQTIMDSYNEFEESKKPVIMIFNGYLLIRLFDLYYLKENKLNIDDIVLNDEEKKVISSLKTGQKGIKELQENSKYKSRSKFIEFVISPLINKRLIRKIGKEKSPYAKYDLL